MAKPNEKEGFPVAKLSAEEEKRFQQLFKNLDVNKDGRVEVHELAEGLKSMRVPHTQAKGHAKEIMQRADQNENLEMDFAEFVQYMTEHEKKLKLAFSHLDRNKDGSVDAKEVKAALGELGLNVDTTEAEKLTKRIDKDGSLSVEWEEFRNFMQLAPSGDLEDIVSYWRQNLMIDIGDNMTCPPEFTKKEKKTGMWWRHLVAGGMAGAVSRSLTAPLDRLKIMLQVHGTSNNLGIVSGFQQMLKEGGVRSLWRGNGINVLKIAPESAIKFAAYEQIKRLIKGDDKVNEVTVVERFAAGSSAGAFSQSIIYPMEVMKTRLAVSKTGQYKGMMDCGMQIWQKEGAKAFYKGYLPNIVGIIPYAGIDLTIYETLKQMYIARNPDQQNPGVMVLLACGTMSSTVGQLASYPLALVRTRLQAQSASESAIGPVALATNIIKEEGPRGLYRGIAPNFMKVLPAVSISYVVYERAKSALGLQSK